MQYVAAPAAGRTLDKYGPLVEPLSRIYSGYPMG